MKYKNYLTSIYMYHDHISELGKYWYLYLPAEFSKEFCVPVTKGYLGVHCELSSDWLLVVLEEGPEIQSAISNTTHI